MEIISDKEEIIFRKEFDGKPRYTLGLSKKDKDNNIVRGYITVRFKNGVELENKTRIKIKKAYFEFNLYENKTYPYIFINDFEVATEKKEEENPFEQMKAKVMNDMGIEIKDEDLPF